VEKAAKQMTKRCMKLEGSKGISTERAEMGTDLLN